MNPESNKQPQTQPIKTVIVMSQITYIPGNCDRFLQSVLKSHSQHIIGVIVIQNLSLKLILQIIWLIKVGCYQMAITLLKNIWSSQLNNKAKILNQHHMPIIKTKTINHKKIINWLQNMQIDVIINNRTRIIFKQNVLNLPKWGCYNLHHGLLPEYRGMYCDLYALHQNQPAGITLHHMTAAIDDGQIIDRRIVSNTGEKNYQNYLAKTSLIEADMITKFLNHLLKNHHPPSGKPNSHIHATYTKTPTLKTIKHMQSQGMKL